MELDLSNVLVVGAVRSGIAACRYLLKKNYKVSVYDRKKSEELPAELTELADNGADLLLGKENTELQDFTLIVISPGVPLTIDLVKDARKLHIPVISEIELAWHFNKADIIAVTGTNGKTTTTTLIGEIMQTEYNGCVAGNIGNALIGEIDNYNAGDVLTVEVSSFQLETVADFRPKVAVFLNLTPDHLNRHGSMENYRQAKSNIFRRQTSEDYTIMNYDDETVRALADICPGRVVFFSHRCYLQEGVFVKNNNIEYILAERNGIICSLPELTLPGNHNLENILAAVAAALIMGISPDNIRHVLSTFKGVAHRLEFVAKIDEVTYVNDSKGTNPDAAIKALDSYQQPIVLIAGGQNKGNDFKQFAQMIQKKCRCVVLFGETAEEIRNDLLEIGYNCVIMTKDLIEAVQRAKYAAHAGDVVLLSPACASWDMFKNYEERGELFKTQVLKN